MALLIIILSSVFNFAFEQSSDLPVSLINFVSIVAAVFISFGFFGLIAKLSKPLEDDFAAPAQVKKEENFGRISRQRFARAAIDAISYPILILDGGLRLIIANKNAAKRFGIKNYGIRLEAFLRDPQILQMVESAIADRSPKQFIIEHHFPNQIFDRIDISTFEYENELRIIIIFTDETEMRKAELVRVDFLANAGHELRTPLASIRGFLETMQNSAKGEYDAHERFLPIMSREAERMQRLIEDIFSLSRIEFNEHVPPNKKIDFINMAEFSANAIEPSIKLRGQSIKILKPPHELIAIADNDELQQVFANLIENASKYGKMDSQITFEILGDLSLEEAKSHANNKWPNSNSLSLHLPDDSEGKYVFARIENVGKGIQARYMPRLSERFYRIDDESAHIRGTGLGLAIVKHIIKRHCGGLFIESVENEKTAFSIIIPSGRAFANSD